MKRQIKISVEGVDVNLHFPFSVLFKLGKKWGIESVNEVFVRMASVCAGSDGDVSLDAMDVWSDILIVCSDERLKKDDALNFIYKNPKVILQIIELLTESMLKQSDEQAGHDDEDLGK